MPIDSPPYTPTTPTFFPTRSQDPRPSTPQYPGPSSPQYLGPTSPQYPGLTSPEYFPSSSAQSPTDLSDLLAELFVFPDPLARVEEIEPLVDLVKPPIKPKKVIEPSPWRQKRKRRIWYPQ